MTSCQDKPLSLRHTRLLFGIILLLAAFLRLRALDGPPLWCDEGLNAYFAQQTPARLLEVSRATFDANPPAYRLTLGLWLQLFGDSAYTLRLLSVVCGLLTILLVFHWGCWLGRSPTGLLAALLMALCPMAVYYQREAKAYPFVALFGCLAFYLWTRYLDRRDKAHLLLWIAYVLAGALAIAGHYYALFLCVAQGVCLGISLISTHIPGDKARRRVRRWLLAQTASLAIVLPWVLLTYDTALGGAATSSTDKASMNVILYLRRVLCCLVGGPFARGWAAGLAVLALGGAALWAICRGERTRVWPLASMIVVPLAIGFVAQSVFAFMYPRFYLYVTPALCLLTAQGLVRLRKRAIPFVVVLAVAWSVALPAAYTPFAGPEDDLRPLAQLLRDYAQENDGILVTYIWQEGILRMYASDVAAHYYIGWFDPESVGEEIGDLFARHPRLWLVTYDAPLQHPTNTAGWWLERHAARALYVEQGHNSIAWYLTPCAMSGMPLQRVLFGEGMELAYAPVKARLANGQPLCVTLCWTVRDSPTTRYSAFVHLADARGKPWAQCDGEAQNGLRPFAQFTRDQPVIDQRALLITPDIPCGDYALITGLYALESGQRLKIAHGHAVGDDYAVIGYVTVMPR